MAEVDGKALKILFNTYWKNNAWIPEKEVSITEEDLRYAVAAGIMFEPLVQRHDEVVQQVRGICQTINLKQAAKAFVSSLSTRRVEWRSALGTLTVMRQLPDHQFATHLRFCPECHYFVDDRPINLSIRNFERFKWGGIVHSHLEYALLDLNQFSRCQTYEPKAEDRRLLKAIVKAISDMPENCSAKNCAKLLKGVFPSNFAEREVLLAIMGYCSILQNPDYPGFLDGFIPDSRRFLPELEVSVANSTYPIAWWNSRHGINHDALGCVFGDFL